MTLNLQETGGAKDHYLPLPTLGIHPVAGSMENGHRRLLESLTVPVIGELQVVHHPDQDQEILSPLGPSEWVSEVAIPLLVLQTPRRLGPKAPSSSPAPLQKKPLEINLVGGLNGLRDLQRSRIGGSLHDRCHEVAVRLIHLFAHKP